MPAEIEAAEESHRGYLGRPALELNPDPASITAQRVLITGAAGSIGRALLNHLLALAPGRIGLLDHHDAALYEAHQAYPEAAVFLGSITDEGFIQSVLASFRPDIVIHCAAVKIVPLLEEQVVTACTTNISATRALAKAAAEHAATNFVFVSSYEAHEPKNVFGHTKRVAELMLTDVAAQYPGTHFVSVRFSLVLDSAGSVSLRFAQLAKAGQPLTVTHPETERYICTLAEAAASILCSMRQGKSGGVLTLDAGKPVKILELARRINENYQNAAGTTLTGERPGEKILESPLGAAADLTPSSVPGLFLTRTIPWQPQLHAEPAAELTAALAAYAPARAKAALQRLSEIA